MPGESPQQSDPITQAQQSLARGDAEAAGAVCRDVPATSPAYAAAQNILGVIALKAGRNDDAIDALGRAIAADPRQPEPFNNLGEALRRAGRYEEAVGALVSALALRPDYPAAARILGRTFEAMDHATLMRVGGAMLAEQRDIDAAAECFRIAAAKRPDDVAATFNYGASLDMQGRAADAIAQFERAQTIHPRGSTRALIATRLPMIYESAEDVRFWRERLSANLESLKRENFRLQIEHIPIPNPFLLAYQGMNDRDVLRDYAALVAPPPSPQIEPKSRSEDRIHIGFVSMFLKNHTVGRINQGLIAQLDRERFHVTVFQLGAYDDAVSNFIRKHADEYIEVPRTLPEARAIIASRKIDLLIWSDLGMDNITWTLAHSRLAPVQAVTWGHPSTTGIPTIDYYVSSELLESEAADAHYTEKLVRLPNLSVYYYRPPAPAAFELNRAAFGLPAGGETHVYGCLQSPFKLLPDFDGVLDDILTRDPRGIVLIPRGPSRHVDEALRRRMSRTMPRAHDRVRFFDPLPYEQYLALSAACDVLLAPIHFGAGNTSYESFAAGSPTVTLPSEFLKGRITYALYRAMGEYDCIATSPQHYAELAVRLATNRDFNRHVRDRILAANHVLYENPAGVRDLERFIIQATRGS